MQRSWVRTECEHEKLGKAAGNEREDSGRRGICKVHGRRQSFKGKALSVQFCLRNNGIPTLQGIQRQKSLVVIRTGKRSRQILGLSTALLAINSEIVSKLLKLLLPN